MPCINNISGITLFMPEITWYDSDPLSARFSVPSEPSGGRSAYDNSLAQLPSQRHTPHASRQRRRMSPLFLTVSHMHGTVLRNDLG